MKSRHVDSFSQEEPGKKKKLCAVFLIENNNIVSTWFPLLATEYAT